VQQRRAELVLAAVGVLLDEADVLQRAQQPWTVPLLNPARPPGRPREPVRGPDSWRRIAAAFDRLDNREPPRYTPGVRRTGFRCRELGLTLSTA
jgi:hypothetical protein